MKIEVKIAKYHRLALIAAKIGAIKCAGKWAEKATILEAQLAKKDFLFSESEIFEAIQHVGYGHREWKPEMAQLIPALVGIRQLKNGPWDWISQYIPVQKMENLGWRDRHINAAIEAALFLQR